MVPAGVGGLAAVREWGVGPQGRLTPLRVKPVALLARPPSPWVAASPSALGNISESFLKCFSLWTFLHLGKLSEMSPDISESFLKCLVQARCPTFQKAF